MITKETGTSKKNTTKTSVRSQECKSTQRKKNSCGAISKKWITYRRAELLASSSCAEKLVYRALCALGYNVIRQQPINTGRRIYFADLYIPELKTIFELDGDYHNTSKQRRLDTNRSNGIWRMGYHVVRLSNRDARNMERIKAKIKLILNKSI